MIYDAVFVKRLRYRLVVLTVNLLHQFVAIPQTNHLVDWRLFSHPAAFYLSLLLVSTNNTAKWATQGEQQ